MDLVYNFNNDLPSIEAQSLTSLPRSQVRRYLSSTRRFDAGRGSPFNGSFCTIIYVQVRKSRSRTAHDVEQITRAGYAQGTHNHFITDDDFARNRNWEPIDCIIQLRTTVGLKIHLTLQVMPPVPRFSISSRRRFGPDARKHFIGLECIKPESLKRRIRGPEPGY